MVWFGSSVPLCYGSLGWVMLSLVMFWQLGCIQLGWVGLSWVQFWQMRLVELRLIPARCVLAVLLRFVVGGKVCFVPARCVLAVRLG